MSKEELERLKKQLQEEEQKAQVEEEIAQIRRRMEARKSSSRHILKQWLKDAGYWNSFLLIVVGLIVAEIGYVVMPFPIEGIGILMILGGVMFTPILRPFWDTKYKPPSGSE